MSQAQSPILDEDHSESPVNKLVRKPKRYDTDPEEREKRITREKFRNKRWLFCYDKKSVTTALDGPTWPQKSTYDERISLSPGQIVDMMVGQKPFKASFLAMSSTREIALYKLAVDKALKNNVVPVSFEKFMADKGSVAIMARETTSKTLLQEFGPKNCSTSQHPSKASVQRNQISSQPNLSDKTILFLDSNSQALQVECSQVQSSTNVR